METLAGSPQINFGTGNKIVGNTAARIGGGVYWDNHEPTGLDLITFSDNTAGFYGNDKAWFIQNMNMAVSSTR